MKMLLLGGLMSLAGSAWASCDIVDAIMNIRPNAQFVQHGANYAGLEWRDSEQGKPSQKEIDDALIQCVQAQSQDKQRKDQAKIDLNTKSKTDAQRIDAIIKYLELDK